MSNYYQQQVTMYMMRRKKRQAALSTDSADTRVDAENPPAKGGWFSRIIALFTRQGNKRPFTSDTGRKRTGLAG